MFEVTKIELRDALASLFPEKEDAKPVVEFTSLEMGWIDFSGAPRKMWHNILTVAADSENGVQDILKNAESEYPDNQIVKDALKNGVIMGGKKEVKKDEYIPFQNILKHINKDNFGEIRRVDCNRSDQVKQYYKSMDNSCTITYSLGTNKDKPNSFAERMMLQTLEDSKDIDTGKNNCWLYRKPNGDFRVDEIPFDIRPDLELSKKLFCKRMESLFEGLNMDKAKDYFAHQNYKTFSLAINYDYSLGDEILEPFTAWIHKTFSGIKETKFQIFFILTGIQSLDTIQNKIDRIITSLASVPIIPIKVANPVNEFDIQKWKGQINLESYTQDEFVIDLKYLKVSEQEVSEFKNSKKITMQVMELFQNKLYDAFYKKP